MAWKGDPFFRVRQEAEQLLREFGMSTLPIDPFTVAREFDIKLMPLPASAGGASGIRASGMLLHVSGAFSIGYPTHVENEGFRRFSVAHEIGHYRLPGHIDAVLDNRGQSTSRKRGFATRLTATNKRPIREVDPDNWTVR